MALSAVLAATGIASAQQPIKITVNGSEIASGRAIERDGRVLVPLRTVMEQLGASVDYIAATGIINASKGGMNVQLHLGSQQAMVNGNQVTLDVPPLVVDGSTLVPLRFLGEALGDRVNWDPVAEVVSITDTSGAAEQITAPATSQGGVQVASFMGSQQGVIGTGGAIKFTLTGTPGGTATVQIPGATDEVPMTETSPGTYTAEVDFPAGRPMALMNAIAVAKLKVGDGTRVTVLSNPINIDTQPPVLTSIWPKDTLVPELRPTVNALFTDGVGPGVAPDGVTLMVDGNNVTSNCQVGSTYIHYTPSDDLAPGAHTCDLKVVDGAGNVTEKTWSFTTSRAMDLAKSISADIPPNCHPGDKILITMIGAPNSQATCSIGDRVTNLPMTESSPGMYSATYVVQPGDHFWNDRVCGQIHTQDNQTFTLTSPQSVTLRYGPPVVPVWTAPAIDAVVGDNVTLQGTAPPNSQVHIWVEYHSHVGPNLPVSGRLYDTIVDADSNGNFSTGQIKLDPGLAASTGMKFTAHAVAIGWDGKPSQVADLEFRRE